MEQSTAIPSELVSQVEDILAIEGTSFLKGGGFVFSGRLLWDAEKSFDILHRRLQTLGYLPLIARRGDKDILTLVPSPPEPKGSRPVVNLLLFLATVLTTLFAGAVNEGYDPLRNPSSLRSGLPFASALLLILGTHELAHYLMSKRHGLKVSLPYFIPVPFGLGTFGAFIKMESPVKDKRGFFDVGLAGPLAGLLVSIPILIIGLSLSQVRPIMRYQGYISEGNSILYLALKYLVFGRLLPARGMDVFLHPVAFAGWLGLLLTAVNLLPMGQLDGGHVAYALLGRAYRIVAQLVLILLLGLSLLWPGWLFWAFFIILTGPGHPRPLNDITELDGTRRLAGLLVILLLVLIITPIPYS